MKYIIFPLFFLLFFLLPKFFLVIYLFFRYFVREIRYEKFLKFIDFVLATYISIALAIMLSKRPYYIGENIGYGDDILHYHNAFEWVSSAKLSEFILEYYNIVYLTGSSEPLFWMIVKFLTIFTQNNFLVHSCITILSLLIIYIAGEIWTKSGLLFIFLYTNTITFFALQGSAIRSGLAFSILLLGYVLFLKKGKSVLQIISPFFHFSLIPVVFVNYLPYIYNSSKKMKIYFGSLIIIFLSGFTYLSYKTTQIGLGSKINARLSESVLDMSSVVQFFVESIFTIFLLILLKNKINNKNLIYSFYLFIFIAFLVLIFTPSGFGRFYRYEYIYIMLIYSELFFKIKPFFRFLMLLISVLWLFYLGMARYVGVFSDNLIGFMNLNVFFN